MTDVWVVRDGLEEVQAAFPTEKAAAKYTHGWVGDGLLSITRETLLTPDAVYPPKIENYREYMTAVDNLVSTIRALGGDA